MSNPQSTEETFTVTLTAAEARLLVDTLDAAKRNLEVAAQQLSDSRPFHKHIDAINVPLRKVQDAANIW